MKTHSMLMLIGGLIDLIWTTYLLAIEIFPPPLLVVFFPSPFLFLVAAIGGVFGILGGAVRGEFLSGILGIVSALLLLPILSNMSWLSFPSIFSLIFSIAFILILIGAIFAIVKSYRK